MKLRLIVASIAIALNGLVAATAEPPVVAGGSLNKQTGLTTFSDCEWIPAEWADGDSFVVKLPDGSKQTVRLYGADCVEWHVNDKNDAARLWAQRRYFGLSGPTEASVKIARSFGEAAAKRTAELLTRPFKVHTAFADGRGDERYQRIYAFVETADGEDLATVLVREGLARAYGVNRMTPRQESARDYRETLRDTELTAAQGHRGIWKHTVWDQLINERQTQRREEAELAIALRPKTAEPAAINPNTASRDELMRLPGIGEALSLRLIEARASGEYRSLDDLNRVPGLSPKIIETLTPYLRFED